jgi:hypothetical protein
VKKFRVYIVILTLVSSQALFVNFTPSSAGERCAAQVTDSLSMTFGEYFVGSGQCATCHSTDTTGRSMVDGDGNDVSMNNDWIGTIMANSARDPFWRAKISHEIAINPQLEEKIETTCTKCHAPMGHYEMSLTTGQAFTLADLDTSSLGMDGVGCMSCHRMDEDTLGLRFVGTMQYADEDVAYGPFSDPWSGPMAGLTGISPVKSDHVRKSELCASCHSLFTETIDLDGQPTGITFFEQATYHEWVNSVYPDQNTECQSCHMPEVEGGAIVASQPDWLFEQSPFGKHYFVGGNEFMLRLMAENRETLNAPATEEQFLLAAKRTKELLRNQTLTLDVAIDSTASDSLFISVLVENQSGHKFPTGYPSRIAWIELLAMTLEGDTIYHNGHMDADYHLQGRDSGMELHHDIIRSEDEVQVYEMVMGDVEGNITTVLERAMTPLKDNRIAPKGFSLSHYTIDTTLVAGRALLDENFNKQGGVEGSGSDEVKYAVKLNGYAGLLDLQVKVNYQSVPVRWLDEMFAESTDEIELFREMYTATDNTPSLVAEFNERLHTARVDYVGEPLVIFPNPTTTGKVFVEPQANVIIHSYQVYSSNGRLVDSQLWSADRQITLPSNEAIYHIRFDTSEGFITRQVMVLIH